MLTALRIMSEAAMAYVANSGLLRLNLSIWLPHF
jgi:hypothetical protein